MDRFSPNFIYIHIDKILLGIVTHLFCIFVPELWLLIYQVCSNYATGVKNGPAPGVTRDMVSFQQIPICKL